MIKQFASGDITVRPFGTFKQWNIQSMVSGATDAYGYTTYFADRLEINEGLNLSHSFFPTSSENYVAASEPVNPSGKYARNVYSLTNSMFYKYKEDPLKIFGVQERTQDLVTGNKEIRNIHDRVVTATLKHNVVGDGMVPNTVRILDYSNIHQVYSLYDDGYTNLRVSGSHFPTSVTIGAIKDYVPRPYWITGSGTYTVTFDNGATAEVSYENARYYADMGLTVTQTPSTSSEWAFDQSTARDWYQANNDHFGESVSSWYNYVAIGTTMDNYSLSNERIGYVGLYKYDDETSRHRLVRKFNFPFTQSAYDTSSNFKDSFGYSIVVKDNFLAVGSPTGSACNTTSYPGFVCVYDKYKGGVDNWGLINLLRGESAGDGFGTSVTMDADSMAVGAPYVSGSAGLVYLFRRKKYMNSGSCDSIPTGSVWDRIVTAMDFCAELETGSYNATQSYVPTFVSGNYSWELETKISSSVSAAGDKFGWSVSLSDDKLIVGTNKLGPGYATLFTCSYSSASLGACPTASWREVKIFRADATYGDLDRDAGGYIVDVSDTLPADYFGRSVGVSGDSILISSYWDKAFKPYASFPSSSVLGAAYFFNYGVDTDCEYYKTFGSRGYYNNNHFGYKVSINGNIAAITSLPNTLARTVNYTSASYILENESYESTGSEDAVLGRVTVYQDATGTGSWYIAGDMKRNKEAYKPYNIYGWSVCVCSDFLVVGAPIINLANSASYNTIISESLQQQYMPSEYSGSAFIYNLSDFEADKPVGNVFYKNGYISMTDTSSNYRHILTGTGSRGFDLTYKGSHTVYENEYLVSIRPGEFNYSTNPSALRQTPLAFDVNGDGVFDYSDLDAIMRFLQHKKFYGNFEFDDNGIILEQDTLEDYSWWGNDLLLTEAEDVLQQESGATFYTGSVSPFTLEAYEYIQTNLVDTGLLDIDGDGDIDLSDGEILALYYTRTLNPTNLSKLLTPAATRIYVKDIEEYLNKYCVKNVSEINPEFLGYQASSSYDPTGSFLAPFVTTIGLYENNELVAVGKLGRPIKNLIDWPVNFIVRFDT